MIHRHCAEMTSTWRFHYQDIPKLRDNIIKAKHSRHLHRYRSDFAFMSHTASPLRQQPLAALYLKPKHTALSSQKTTKFHSRNPSESQKPQTHSFASKTHTSRKDHSSLWNILFFRYAVLNIFPWSQHDSFLRSHYSFFICTLRCSLRGQENRTLPALLKVPSERISCI